MRLNALLLVLAALLWVRPAAAETARPLRVLVWLEPGSDALLSRIRGQTNDLEVELVVEEGEPSPRDLGAQLRLARRLATSHDAPVVVWFDAQGAELVVRLALPGDNRLLEREVGAARSSATLEAAALVVRESVQAILAGEAIGVEAPERFVNLPEPEPTTSTKPIEAPPPRPLPVPLGPPGLLPRAKEPPGSELAVGWRLVADGMANTASEELAGRLSLVWPWVEALLEAAGGLPRDKTTQFGTYRVARQELSAGLGLPLARAPLRATVALRAGALAYYRWTTDPAPGVRAAPARLSASGVVGPELRLRFPARSAHVAGELALGTVLVLGSTRIGYRVDGQFRRIDKALPIQPYLAVGMAVPLSAP
jgi:hypothetical protein